MAEINKRTGEILVDGCYEHIMQESEILGSAVNKKLINSYLGPERKVHCLNDVYMQIVESLKNSSMKPKVIKWEKRDKRFIFDFDYKEVANNYGRSTRRLKKAVKTYNPQINTNRRIWGNFLQGILDSAYWMIQFKNLSAFEKYIKVFQKQGHEGIKSLARSIGDGRIKGMGFALALDFLKEIGLSISRKCAKPDVHVIKTLYGLGFIKDEDQIEAFDAVAKIAEATGWDEYSIDKLIWLSNSGNFYNHKLQLWHPTVAPQYRKKLVKLIKRRIADA